MIINEVFDDKFTKSQRGLLIIFSIGFMHQLLGVILADAKISIPGLPEIIFAHPENIIHVYVFLTIYATYRYILNSGTQFSEVCRMSFAWGIETLFGRAFSALYITDDMYKVSDDERFIKNSTVVLNAYEEKSISYKVGFKIDSCFFKECWVELPPYASNPKLISSPFKEKWGFYDTTYELDPEAQAYGVTSYEAYRIKHPLIKLCLYMMLLLSVLICFFKNPKAFDYWTPAALNIALVFFILNGGDTFLSVVK